ncbi:putative monocarboxylate transporter [Zopfochytrium polystomum]|nr:putative monocarboxylate transporter [Zopfochytrium polystomum]
MPDPAAAAAAAASTGSTAASSPPSPPSPPPSTTRRNSQDDSIWLASSSSSSSPSAFQAMSFAEDSGHHHNNHNNHHSHDAHASDHDLDQMDQPLAGKEAFESYPDGGRDAWTVVIACFALFTTIGGLYSWGVFQDRLVSDGVAPASTLAWIGSLQASIEAMIALPGARLVAAYGPRRVALLGTALVTAGPVLASFCPTSVAGLIVTQGIIYGLGLGLLYFAAATLPSAYFLRRRNLATGIVYAGAGIGGAVYSVLAARLLETVSVAWTLRCVALLSLLVNAPAVAVLRSRAEPEPFLARGKRMVNWSAFKDRRFALLVVGSSIALFPLFVPPFFLPLYAGSVGLSPAVSSVILAGFNLASAIGRLGFGLFADSLLGSLNTLVVCLLLVGVSTLVIWPLATTAAPLIAFAVVNGLCSGGMFSLFPGTVANIFGSRDLGQFFSLIVFFWLPGYFLGSPIAGYLLQAYGGPEAGLGAYRPAIFYSGALSLTAAGCVLAVRVLQDRRLFKKI